MRCSEGLPQRLHKSKLSQKLKILKQGKLSAECYIEESQSSGSTIQGATKIICQFMAGLSPRDEQAATVWTAKRKISSERVDLTETMNYYRLVELQAVGAATA